MNTRRDIDDFVSKKTVAVLGMSRSATSFGAMAAKELSAKGYRLFFVNPNATEIAGQPCYPDVASLPEKVDAALVLTPPSATERAVRDAAAAGITHLWLQQGAESPEAIAFCRESQLPAVSGHCILMFTQPVGGLHGLHRFFKGLFRGLPK